MTKVHTVWFTLLAHTGRAGREVMGGRASFPSVVICALFVELNIPSVGSELLTYPFKIY